MNAENSMRERIDTMFRNDRLFAYALLIGAWLAVWFVVDQVAALGPPGKLMGLVYLSAFALCVFNTASIIANEPAHVAGCMCELESCRAKRKQK